MLSTPLGMVNVGRSFGLATCYTGTLIVTKHCHAFTSRSRWTSKTRHTSSRASQSLYGARRTFGGQTFILLLVNQYDEPQLLRCSARASLCFLPLLCNSLWVRIFLSILTYNLLLKIITKYEKHKGARSCFEEARVCFGGARSS